MSNIPLMLAGGFGGNGLQTIIGTVAHNQEPKTNTFWWVVIDLKHPNQTPVLIESSSSNTEVPANVLAIKDKPDHLLCFGFNDVFTIHMPSGDLYEFLINIGAGGQLKRIEQIVEQSSSNYLDVAGYLLVATLNPDDEQGFEVSSIHENPILTCELMPVTFNGHTIYTPIKLG